MSVNQVTTSNQLNAPETVDGYQVGKAATSLVGFYGATPVAQPAGGQAAVTTTASTTSTPYGYASQAQADNIVALVNEIRAALVLVGLLGS